MAETTIYLATSAKSNSAYLSIDKALEFVRQNGNQPVPLHLRNAPTKLMKNLDYGKEYKYSHDYKDHFVVQEFLPSKISGTQFWTPQDNAAENRLADNMKRLWGDKKNYNNK